MSEPEGEALFEALSSLPAPPKDYTEQDKYRDFRKVFLSSEEGGRVLRQLLAWGHLFGPSIFGNPIDPYRVVALEAERNYALRLLKTIHDEPKAKPAQTARKT